MQPETLKSRLQEDLVSLTNFEPVPQPVALKTRLHSYDLESQADSLSSPDSSRSRISSGEDELEHCFTVKKEDWACSNLIITSTEEGFLINQNVGNENEFDPSLTDLNALFDPSGTVKMDLQGQIGLTRGPTPENSGLGHGDDPPSAGNAVEWTYLEPAQPSYQVQSNIEDITMNVPNNATG